MATVLGQTPRDLDARDRQILRLVQRDATLAQAEIARQVGLSTAAVHERLKKLEASGVIRRWTAVVDPAAVGVQVTAFVEVFLEHPRFEPAFLERLRELDEVLECHHVTGEFSLLLKVRVRDMEALQHLLLEQLGSHRGRAPDAHGRGALDREGRDVHRPRTAGRETAMTTTMTTMAAGKVHDTLGRHMLADGYDMVLDMEQEPRPPPLGRAPRPLVPRHVLVLRHAAAGDEPSRSWRTRRSARSCSRAALVNPTNSDIYTVEFAEFVETFGRVGIPSYLPHAFFVAGGALGVENALKAAIDWKVRRNFREGLRAGAGAPDRPLPRGVPRPHRATRCR